MSISFSSLDALRADPWLTNAARSLHEFVAEVPAGTLAIVLHGDMDGVVSAGAVAAAIHRLQPGRRVAFKVVGTDEYDFADLDDWVASAHPVATIFLDLSIANHPAELARTARQSPHGCFVYDHHALNDRGFEPPSGVLYRNPHVNDGHSPLFATFMFAWHFAGGFSTPLFLATLFAEGVDHAFPELVRALVSQTSDFPVAELAALPLRLPRLGGIPTALAAHPRCSAGQRRSQ